MERVMARRSVSARERDFFEAAEDVELDSALLELRDLRRELYLPFAIFRSLTRSPASNRSASSSILSCSANISSSSLRVGRECSCSFDVDGSENVGMRSPKQSMSGRVRRNYTGTRHFSYGSVRMSHSVEQNLTHVNLLLDPKSFVRESPQFCHFGLHQGLQLHFGLWREGNLGWTKSSWICSINLGLNEQSVDANKEEWRRHLQDELRSSITSWLLKICPRLEWTGMSINVGASAIGAHGVTRNSTRRPYPKGREAVGFFPPGAA